MARIRFRFSIREIRLFVPFVIFASPTHYGHNLSTRCLHSRITKEPKFYLIAESNLNDVRVIQPRDSGGYGLDAPWCDDFHHSLHTLLTGERTSYYADFGRVEDLVKSLRDGFVDSWQYSLYRRRHYGSSSADLSADQSVVFSQNHDHVGNRMLGERLPKLVFFEGLKLVSHSGPDLIGAVREGRNAEFQEFQQKLGFILYEAYT